MNLLHALELDLGSYVAAMAIFTAIVCYRANPLRAVNRYMSGMLATIGAWQFTVALARTTHHPEIWGPLCIPFGFGILVLLFLIHDACVDPHSRLRTRLGRSRLLWIAIGILGMGVILAYTESVSPGLFPGWYRIIAVAALVSALFELRKQRRHTRGVNPYEALLFQVTAVYVMLTFVIYELNRTSVSSRLNTILTFIYLSIVIGLLFSERVFDAGDTAKLALGYLIRFVMHVVFLLALAHLYMAFAVVGEDQVWPLAVLVAVMVYPTGALSAWLTNKIVHSNAPSTIAAVRDAAMDVLGSAETEHILLRGLEEIATRFLGNLEVAVIAYTSGDQPRHDLGLRLQLAAVVRHGMLSPDTAVREFRGAELDQVLQSFSETRTGAVLKYEGRQTSALMFVSERGRGTSPITGRELDLLYELTTIAAIGAERLRAVEDGFRTQALAMVGHMAADFNQASRAQISAIQSLVEAVKEGRESELSTAFRESVYNQTLSLAASHNMTLEMMRLGPGKLTITRLPVAQFVDNLVSTLRRTGLGSDPQFQIENIEPGLAVSADDRLLRQVILNVFRNSIHACPSNARLNIHIRTHADHGLVHIEISHNALPVHGRADLPPAWTQQNTKPDGVRLSLAFSQQAMRAIGGNISYVPGRHGDNARICVDVPRAFPANRAQPDAAPAFAG